MPKKGFSIKPVMKAYWPYVTKHKAMVSLSYLGAGLGVAVVTVAPWLYKALFDTVANNIQDPSRASFAHIIIGILVVNVAGWLLYRASGFSMSYVQPAIMAEMDRHNLDHLLGHSYQYFSDNFAGSLQRNVQRFARSFERIMDETAWNVSPLVLTITISAVVLFFRNTWLGVGVLIFSTLVILANYGFSVWKLKYDLKRAQKDTEVSGALADAVSNSVNVKLFSGQDFERKKFFKVTEEHRRAQSLAWYLAEASFAFQAFLGILMEFGLMYLAVRLWQEGIITAGDIILVQSYLLVLLLRLWNVGRVMRNLYEAFSDAQEMVDILEKPYGVMDAKKAKALKVTQGSIHFKELAFNYNQTREVLKDFELTVNPGERVALVGPSGAGKSTIVKLLLRFYDPDGGSIRIDGQPIGKVTQASLRDQVALVPQEPYLFHRTVRENLAYGRREATDEEIEQASRLAHCHDFIKDLPEGYGTYVGERGIKLSGGERQRVAIARAMLKNAPILVLDEATSSLDSESESKIQDALKSLMQDRTVIVIAHRLSTIMQMDRIVVMEGGRIVDQGTHQELLAHEGLYRNLWNIQAGGFLA